MKFKKLAALTLAVCVVFAMSACGDKKDDAETASQTDVVETDNNSAETEKQDDVQSEENKQSEETQNKTTNEKTEDASSKTTASDKKTDTPAQTQKTTSVAPASSTPQAEPAPAPAETAPVEPAPAPVQEAPATPAPEKTAPTAADASKFIGQSASSLAAAIGQPNNKTYASSCIGDGEDGEWYYNGFTVYTYRDTDGTETVEDVFGN